MSFFIDCSKTCDLNGSNDERLRRRSPNGQTLNFILVENKTVWVKGTDWVGMKGAKRRRRWWFLSGTQVQFMDQVKPQEKSCEVFPAFTLRSDHVKVLVHRCSELGPPKYKTLRLCLKDPVRRSI